MVDPRYGDRFTSLMCMARGGVEDDSEAFMVLHSSSSDASLAGAEVEEETAGSLPPARLLTLFRSLRNIFILSPRV
jgi:hypothetical protein